jgi:hypothetical protein
LRGSTLATSGSAGKVGCYSGGSGKAPDAGEFHRIPVKS